MREFCTSLARTDLATPAVKKVSLFDDPVQQLLTVTMGDLKEADSGWYMCGVEVGGGWTPDVVAYTYIKVVHGMSVVNSRLSGEEGSSVTVECHYSERYRDSEKKWCRSGDWRTCLLTGADGSYEDPSVALSDDRSWTFTITLKELRMRDSGWYWCSVGAQQMLVQVLVTPRPTTTAATETSPPTPSQSAVLLPPPEPITEQSRSSHRHILEALLVCASIVVLVGLALLARKLWRRHRRDPVQGQLNWIKARHNEFSGEVSDPQSTGVAFLNADTQDVHMY